MKLAGKAHRSVAIAEALQKTFGRTIPSKNDTCWNGQFEIIHVILKLPTEELNHLLTSKEDGLCGVDHMFPGNQHF